MGTRMEINPDGNRCEHFFDPDHTPYRIYCYFFEIEQCPDRKLPPNLHLFTLYQSDVNPCEWSIDPSGDGWTIHLTYRVAPQTTILNMVHSGGGLFFDGSAPGPAAEHDPFTNDLNFCGGANFAKGGFAVIFWLVAAFNILVDFNLPDDGNTFMEFFVTGDKKPIYKFCNVKWLLNQKILLA